jgi:hypothetical protein
MRTKEPKLIVTTIRLKNSVLEGLQQEASLRGCYLSDVIRESLAQYDIQKLAKK